MKKAKGILVFGILFIILSGIYTITFFEISTMEPKNGMILQQESKMAFIRTTFWSGIIMIVISIYLWIKAKKNDN